MLEALLITGSKQKEKGWNKELHTVTGADDFVRLNANGGFSNGRFWAFGGTNGSAVLRSLDVYSKVVQSHGSYSNFQAMTTLFPEDGEMLCMGGQTGSTTGTAMNYVVSWDLSTGAATGQNGIPFNSTYSHAAKLNDTVYYFGGRPSAKYLAVRDPITKIWSWPETDVGYDTYGACSFVHDGAIYVFNGDTGNNLLKFNPATNKLTPSGTIPKNTAFTGYYQRDQFIFVNGLVYFRTQDKFGRFNPFTEFEEIIWEDPLIGSNRGFIGYDGTAFYLTVPGGYLRFEYVS